MRIILDTNVIVSAFLSYNGVPSKILTSFLDGYITLVYDNLIFAEYIRVLFKDKLKIDKDKAGDILDSIQKKGEYGIANTLRLKFEDESDKKFYELFKTANVDYLITGNKKHFPKEKGIVSPREFLDLY